MLTNEKLLRVTTKAVEKMDEEIGEYTSVINQLEYLGSMELISMFTGEEMVNDEDHYRFKLELQEKNIPIDKDHIEELQEWYLRKRVKWRDRLMWLFKIQYGYEISCLQKYRYKDVAGQEKDLWRPTKAAPFLFTEQDKTFLMGKKDYYVRLWRQHCEYYDLPMYQLSWSEEEEPQRTWKHISSSLLDLQTSFYTWAFIFDDTNCLNLLIGNGNDYTALGDSVNIISSQQYDIEDLT